MERHAYLILAHQQWDLLKKLINLLDDERNDIYIHFDRKSKDAPIEIIKECAQYSKIITIDRICVSRGTYSLFEAEMMLLRAATNHGKYSYYHLLSGQDLPLKNQDQLHNFFAQNRGYNFVDVITPDMVKKDWKERASLYQFFSCFTLSNSLIISLLAKSVRKIALVIQRAFRVDRFKKFEEQGFLLCFGSNWFSITHAFAEYLISKEPLIRQMFQNHTFAPEELIPQTFLWSSEFRKSLYDDDNLDHELHRANMRMVFWSGKVSPETITMKHIEQIRTTTNLFARKFDIINHPDAVNAVIDMIDLDKIKFKH